MFGGIFDILMVLFVKNCSDFFTNIFFVCFVFVVFVLSGPGEDCSVSRDGVDEEHPRGHDAVRKKQGGHPRVVVAVV